MRTISLQELDEKLRRIEVVVEDALLSEPTHHDRWYIEQVADILEFEYEKQGIAP
jgi:hypothetical protein